ncbi:MAG: transglycosylase SLT domain-containing protein [Bryobacteraceae bacterium]
MKLAALSLFCLASLSQAGSSSYFAPQRRLDGIGVDRDGLSDDALAERTRLMVESQTFIIMREPKAVAGAKRVTTDPKLQAVFRSAAAASGFPQDVLEAIAYLESWGDVSAESWAGSPRGIMQISLATARTMGLKVGQVTRYRTVKVKVRVKGAGKAKYKTVSRRTPYTVIVRDERLIPERAIPAAAHYLAGMERTFGGRDWAIFAYHCGQGCVAEMQELTRRARGIPEGQITVPRMYFSSNPAWNRELYQAIQQQMQRDYSPTYYFRILCATQLLAQYRSDPAAFAALAEANKSEFNTAGRAPHRLSVWLKREDLIFHSTEDIRADNGKLLARASDRPEFFGYALRFPSGAAGDREELAAASPATLGALAYIAFETRRLFEAMGASQEQWRPLPVSALVEPEDDTRLQNRREVVAHSSGQVFDVDYSGLPPMELECLRFILDDLGDDGYLGFVEEGRDNLHIGCSPSSREFFAAVYEEAASAPAVPAQP